MEDFGGRLASVWSELRPTTRGLVERALQTPSGPPASSRTNTANAPYDARDCDVFGIAGSAEVVLDFRQIGFDMLLLSVCPSRDRHRRDSQ